jgi:hypothetical protein
MSMEETNPKPAKKKVAKKAAKGKAAAKKTAKKTKKTAGKTRADSNMEALVKLMQRKSGVTLPDLKAAGLTAAADTVVKAAERRGLKVKKRKEEGKRHTIYQAL